MKRICRMMAASVLGVALVVPAPAAAGERKEGLRDLAAELAASTRRVAEKNKQAGVRIGYFTPKGIDNGNAGGAFMSEVALALGTFANPASPLELAGEYF